ncbi:MAG: mercury resistance system periplasmic binding protein MerP [Proteobacteria bacterium]|nr:mercury resistance system periplasmic binding protein MerP [Pseudomonadota bacterium]MBS0462210.1 mercury resistance system periplasmic binding protein MerP [Pseudomonadota bacterium]
MRKTLFSLLALLPLTAFAVTPKMVTLEVPTMTCPVCPITVKKALVKVPGVSAVSVDYEGKTATVVFDAEITQPDALTRATKEAGYPSSVRK